MRQRCTAVSDPNYQVVFKLICMKLAANRTLDIFFFFFLDQLLIRDVQYGNANEPWENEMIYTLVVEYVQFILFYFFPVVQRFYYCMTYFRV